MKMRPRNLAPALLGAALACSSSAPPHAAESSLLSPADLVASLADVANGRNADMAETGLALKRIELGTYGTCEMSGKQIPRARLEAIGRKHVVWITMIGAGMLALGAHGPAVLEELVDRTGERRVVRE